MRHKCKKCNYIFLFNHFVNIHVNNHNMFVENALTFLEAIVFTKNISTSITCVKFTIPFLEVVFTAFTINMNMFSTATQRLLTMPLLQLQKPYQRK